MEVPTVVINVDSEGDSDSEVTIVGETKPQDVKPKLKTFNNNKKNSGKCNIERVKCKIKSATVLKLKRNLQDVRSQSAEKFKATFLLFEKYACSLRSKCSNPSRAFHARRVAVFIVEIMDIFHINRYLIVHILEDGYLNSHLITILACYTDMELSASLYGKETEIKVANRIILALNKYLDYSLHHIIEMFLTIRLRSTRHLNILSHVFKIFADCLKASRPLSCRLYILYILFFKEWANLHHTNEEEQETVKNLAADLLRNKVQHLSIFPRSLTKIIPFLKTAVKETLTRDLMNLNLDMPKTIASFLEYSNTLRHTRGSDEPVSLTAKLCSFNKRFRQESIIQNTISDSTLKMEPANIVHDLTSEDGGLLSIMRRVIPAEEQDDINVIESNVESNIPGGQNRDKVETYFNSDRLEPEAMVTKISETENCTDKLNELPNIQGTNCAQNSASYLTSNYISQENASVLTLVFGGEGGSKSEFVITNEELVSGIIVNQEPVLVPEMSTDLHQNMEYSYPKPNDSANFNVESNQDNQDVVNNSPTQNKQEIPNIQIYLPSLTSNETENFATTLTCSDEMVEGLSSVNPDYDEDKAQSAEKGTQLQGFFRSFNPGTAHMNLENHFMDNNSGSHEENIIKSDIAVQEVSSSNQQLINPVSNEAEREKNDIGPTQGIIENADNFNMSQELKIFANHEKESLDPSRVEYDGLSDTFSDNSTPVEKQNDVHETIRPATTITTTVTTSIAQPLDREYCTEPHNRTPVEKQNDVHETIRPATTIITTAIAQPLDREYCTEPHNHTSDEVTAMDVPMEEESEDYYKSVSEIVSTEKLYCKSISQLNRPEKTNNSENNKVQISCPAHIQKTAASKKVFPEDMEYPNTNRQIQKTVQFTEYAENKRIQNRPKKSALKKPMNYLSQGYEDCLSDGVNKSSDICNVNVPNRLAKIERFDYTKNTTAPSEYISNLTPRHEQPLPPQIPRISNHPSTNQRSTSQLLNTDMDISRSSQKRQINTMSKNIKTIENTHIKNSTQTLSNMENGMNTLQKSSQTQKRNRNLKVINENYTDVDSLNINNSRKQTRSSNRRKKTDDNNSHEEEKMLSYVIPGTSTHKRVYLNVTDTNVNYGELAFNTKKPTVHLEYITNYPEYKDAIARLPRVPPDRSLLRALFKSSAPKRKTRKRKSKTKNKGNNQSEIKSKSANNSEGKIVFFNQMPITGDASDDEINCYSESETFVRRTRRSVAKTRTDTEETEDESDFRRPLFAAGSYLSSTPLSSNNTLAKVKRNQKQLSSNTETNHKNISSKNLPLEDKSSSDLMIQPITETHIAANVSNTSDTSREFVENSMSSQFKPQQKRPRGRPKKIPLNNTNNLNSNETKSEILLKNTTSQSENIVNKFKKPKPTLTNNSSDIITLPHEHSENKTTNCDNKVSSLNCEDTISASEFLVNPFIDCDTFMSNEHLKPCSVSLTKIGDKKKQGVLPDLLNEIYMDQTMPIDEEENQFNEQLQKEYVTFNKANKFRTMQTKRNKLLVNKRNNLDLELLDTCYDQVEDADHLPLHSKIIGLSSGIVKDQDPKVRFLDTTVSNLCIDNYAASKDIKDKMLDNVNIETNTTESAIFTKNKDCTFSGKTSSTENKLNIEITCTNKNKTSDSEHPNVSKDNISNAVLFQCELELMLSSEKNNAKESKCKQKESDKLLSPNLDEINKTRNENHKLTASSEINTVTEDALVTSTVKDVATVKIFDIEDSKNIKKSSTKIFHNEISKVETVHVQHNNNYTKLPMPKDSCNKTVSPGESKEKFDNSLQTLNKNPVDFEEEYKTEIKIAELISNTEVKLADPTNPNLKETNKLEKIISNESFEDLLPAVINQNDNEFNSRKQRRKKKTLKDVVSVSSVIKSMKDIKQNNTEILRKDKTKKEDAQVPLMTSTIYRTKSKGALKNFDCLNDSNIILSLKTPSSSLKDLKVAPSEEKKVTLLEHTTGIPFEEKKTNPSEGKKITLLEDTKVIQYAEKKVNPSDAKKVSLLEENKMKQLEDTKVIQFEEKKVNPSDAKKVSLLEENKMKQLEDTKVIQFEEKKVNPSEAKKVTLLEENKLKQLETTKVIPFKEKKVSLLEEKKVKLLETTKVIPFKEKKVNPSEAKEVTLLEKKKMTLLKDIKVMPIKEKHVTPLKEKKEILLKDKKLTQLEDKKVTRTEEIKETPLEAIVSTKLKDVVLKSKNKEWPKTDTPIRKVVKRPNSQTSNKNNGSIIKKAKLELSLNKEKKIINKMETKININESKVKVINPEKAQPQKHSTSIVKNSLNFTDRLAELDEKFVKEIKKPLKKISGSNKNNFKNTNSQIMKSCRKRNFADTDTLETQQVKVVEKKVAINEGNGSIVGESLKSPDKHPNIVLDTIHFNGHITVSLDKSNKLVPSYDSKVSRILPSETGCNNRSKSSKVNILLNGINKKKIENQLIEGISKINTKPMKVKDIIQNSVDIASDKTQKNVKQTEKSGKRSRVVAFHPTVNFIGGEPLENANLNDKHIFFEADISKKLCVGSVDSKEISANSASEKLSKKVEQKDNKTIKQLSSKAVTPKAVIPSFKQTPQKIINDEDTFFGIKIKKTVKNTTVQNSEHQIIEINTNRKKEVNTAQTKRNVRRKNNSLFNMIDIKKQQSNKIPTNKNVESKECRLNKKINGKRKEANTPTFNKNNNKNLINKLSVNCDSVESDDNSSDSSSGSLIIEIDSAPSFVDPNIPNTLISDIVPNTSHYRAISPSELHIGSNMEVETVLDNDTWGSDQIDDDDDDSRMDYTQYNFH